jgi:Calcineurin-like phosphoesterase
MRIGRGFVRRVVVPTALAYAVFAAGGFALAGNGTRFNPNSANELTIAVYGDSPYGTTPTDTAEFDATPDFIASINGDPKIDLVLHVGDIHSGKQYCTEAYDESIYELWTQFKDPLVYTPGDNEWTDCNKLAEGGGAYNKTTQQVDRVLDSNGNPVDYAGGDPNANLDLVRSIFFSRPGYTLGGRKKQVLSQTSEFDPSHPSDAKYVENVMWEQSKVLFVTINLPGGSNNDMDVWYGAPTETAAQTQERNERTAADLRWLEAAFARALAYGAEAIVIGAQADMWDPEKGAAHQTGYEPFVQSIASLTTDFGRPVLMFNGDSHVYQTGNPLSPSDPNYAIHPYYDVANFHRIVVHGSTFPLEWLRLTIEPGVNAPASADSFGPFRWERVIP